jgi:O-antigen ligase
MISVLIFWGTYISCFIIAIARNPVFAVIVYQAVYFFYPQDRWWGYMVPNWSYSFFTVVLMLAVYLMNFKLLKENKVLVVPQLRWAYFLGGCYCLIYFNALLPTYHLESMINFVKLLIIITLAYKLIDSSKKLDFVLWGYLFGVWYISYLTFQVGRNRGDRVEGIGTVDSPEANGIAAAIVPGIVLFLYYFWMADKWWKKGLYAIGGIFLANAIVLINSRGAFLAGAISIAYFIWFMFFSTFQRKGQKATVVAIVILGLAGVAKIVDDGFIERMSTIKTVKLDEEQENAATRLIFWKAAWDMTKDNPFGAGYRTFNVLADVYIPGNVNTGGHRARAVHSMWFEALSEVGYIGLLCLLFMILACFRTSKKCKKVLRNNNDIDNYFKMLALEAALIAFILAASFLNRFRAEVLYWLVMYTAVAYNIYVLQPLKNKERQVTNTENSKVEV